MRVITTFEIHLKFHKCKMDIISVSKIIFNHNKKIGVFTSKILVFVNSIEKFMQKILITHFETDNYFLAFLIALTRKNIINSFKFMNSNKDARIYLCRREKVQIISETFYNYLFSLKSKNTL